MFTYLAQYSRIKPRLLEKLDGDFTSDNTNSIGVGLTEELAVNTLLLWR